MRDDHDMNAFRTEPCTHVDAVERGMGGSPAPAGIAMASASGGQEAHIDMHDVGSDAPGSGTDPGRLAPLPVAGSERRLRLVVAGTDAAAASIPAARIYVADDGGRSGPSSEPITATSSGRRHRSRRVFPTRTRVPSSTF